jgi:hypothetical protein
MKSVYSAVRTGPLNKAIFHTSLKELMTLVSKTTRHKRWAKRVVWLGKIEVLAKKSVPLQPRPPQIRHGMA